MISSSSTQSKLPKPEFSTVTPKNFELKYNPKWIQTLIIETFAPQDKFMNDEEQLIIELESSRGELRKGKGKLLRSLKDLR